MAQSAGGDSPITTEILRNAFVSIAEDMNAALIRSAYSPLIYEGKDCAVGLLDQNGNVLGQSLGVPLFLGNLSLCVQMTAQMNGWDYFQDGDVIFLNDVFEHLESPLETLSLLATKLNPGGRIFVDTPKTFWLYPALRAVWPSLYGKLCDGTVTKSHLQIWTRRSFEHAVKASSLGISRYAEVSEFTMPPDFYLASMAVKNAAVRLAGRLFYANARWLAKNKIMSVLARTEA